MLTDSEGLIFRQVKTVNGRRIVLLFTRKFGKISAGTGITEQGKGKTALAMRPFTYGKYELFKNRETFHINKAEVLKSYYKIGEDVEKYMCCSHILEFTEKVLHEETPAPKIFETLLDFFEIMERRKSKYRTLSLAYQIKIIQFWGAMPETRECVRCKSNENLTAFDVKNGGVICENCLKNLITNTNETLIYKNNFDIINILQYISNNPLKSFEKLALEENTLKFLQQIIKNYAEYHLDVKNLKSEGFLIN